MAEEKNKLISIIYANRNKEISRIKASLNSLRKQNLPNFEVIFVDYGSQEDQVIEIKKLVEEYTFLRCLYLDVGHLLWNKSKALNFGLKMAHGEFIFIADVDLIFHPDVTIHLNRIANSTKFFLYNLGYLGKHDIPTEEKDFENFKPDRYGTVNGMVFTSKKALMELKGFDEFFHFYGGEDVDLYDRLERLGLHRERFVKPYFYHNWHPGFLSSSDTLLTVMPRINNIMRINQIHFQRNKERNILVPDLNMDNSFIINKEDKEALNYPSRSFRIANILSHVEHFLKEEIKNYKGEVINVIFIEEPYYNSIKHKLKSIMGRQSQQYCSMKTVNDIILKEILYVYRNYNYSFNVEANLKTIVFRIKL